MPSNDASVRKLLFRHGVLWAGDEMGSVCQWSANLSCCNLKKEYYTEIWSMLVSRDNNTVYTARDNEIIVADISSISCNNPNVVLVNCTLPGQQKVYKGTLPSNPATNLSACCQRCSHIREIKR